MYLNIQKAQLPIEILYDFPFFAKFTVDTAYPELKLDSISESTMPKFLIPSLRRSSGFIVGWFELSSVKGLFGPKFKDIEKEITDFLKPWNVTHYSACLPAYLRLAHAANQTLNKNQNTVYLVVVFKPTCRLALLIPEEGLESAVERL